MKPEAIYLALCLCLVALVGCWERSDQVRRPNLVILFADDLGYADLGSYGADDIGTPNIDELAYGGARFTSFYSASPVCSPARAALLTGQYPHNAGVSGNVSIDSIGLPADKVTLAEALDPLGYTSALIGKWHLGTSDGHRPLDQGFDYFFGVLGGVVDHWSHMNYWEQNRWKVVHDMWRGEERYYSPGRSLTELLTEESLGFLDANRDAPFFLYVAFTAPHWPVQPRKESLEEYQHLDSPRREYAALVSELDQAVGKIVGRLDDLGIRDHTLVVFLSDNGHSVEPPANFGGGSSGILLGHKKSLFEGGIREPMITNMPGVIPSGRVLSEPTIIMDIYPTFVRLAGGVVPESLDGIDIWKLATGEVTQLHTRPLIFKWQNQEAVRLGRWKFVRNARLHDDSRERIPKEGLYDLFADPGETTNLSKQNQELVSQLRQLLD